MLVSVHIPKSAGSSFRYVLRCLYGERTWDNYGQIFTRDQAKPGIVPAGTACIHGHFLADAFDDLFPGRKLITWVRHPVERVVSHYYHFLRTPDMRDDCCRALYEQKLSLRQFADLEWMCNASSRYFVGKPIEDFDFVGVVEHFPESLRLFGEKFADGQALPEPQNNVNFERTTPSYALSPEEHEHILERNAVDFQWYERAKARLGG